VWLAFRLVRSTRLPEGQNRTNQTNFGYLKVKIELMTKFSAFGLFGLVFSVRSSVNYASSSKGAPSMQ
jgi:hypothetical protein